MRSKKLFVDILMSGTIAYFSGLIIIAGVCFGGLLDVDLKYKHRSDSSLEILFHKDALNYRSILTQGYELNRDRRSNVAFFPVYPVLALVVSRTISISQEAAMTLLANAACAIGFLLLLYYANRRFQQTLPESPSSPAWVLVGFGLWPSSFFLRMPYAESLFCCLVLLVLIGIANRWPLFIITLITGLTTATRPVGIALAAALWWKVLSPIQTDAPPLSWKKRVFNLAWVIPLSCWGLFGYMSFLWIKFDAPLAFAQTQQYWTFQSFNNAGFGEKAWSLVTFEPIWGVYNPTSQRFWARGDTQSNPLFSCLFWNPIFYLFSWFLIIIGWCKRWLTGPELVLSLMLLLVPYVTRAYEMSMASHARFAAVVIPQYLVLGRLFAMLPPAVGACFCGLIGLMLGLWTALFSAGFPFF